MLEINTSENLEESVFFDESLIGSSWHDPFVGAVIESNRNLGWFIDFSRWARKGLFEAFPSFKLNWNGSGKIIKNCEYKSDWFLSALRYYPKRNKVLSEVYRSSIVFVDPLCFLRSTEDLKILPNKNRTIEFSYDGKKQIIRNSDHFYGTLEKLIISAVQSYFRINHPFQRIKRHLQILSKHYWYTFDTSTFPGPIIPSIRYLNKSGEANIFNSALSALMAFPAFFDFFSDEYSSLSLANPYYGSHEILNRGLSRLIGTNGSCVKTVVYDNGHDKTIGEIEDFRKQLVSSIPRFDLSIPTPKLIQMNSKSVERIQAADFVAGIARDVFKCLGKIGLESKFPKLLE